MSVSLQYVQLLGQPRARLESDWVDLPADRRFYLLAYLACQDEWATRERIAYLFWPDSPSPTARHNLRQLLKRLRALPWLTGLETDERQLRWQVQSDVTAFKKALAEARWEEALVLYGGPLLEGISGDEVPEFARWLELERVTLQDRWRKLLLEQAGRLVRDHQPRQAVSVLTALLHHDEFDEEALQAYMSASVHAGHQKQALEAYEAFARRLKDELGLTPTVPTQRLVQSIREGRLLEPVKLESALKRSAVAPARLPHTATPFIGRDVELAEVAHLLANPECRLLTIVGLGGVGKSRLALAAAQELAPHYAGGVAFVALEALTESGAIPTALAETLGIDMAGATDPLAQVAEAIGTNEMLLVLDNYEHLLGGARVASELLRRCPNLTLLATSREPLKVSDEWLLALEGLAYPPEGTSLEDALSYDALRLFIQRAERVRPGYRLSEAELPAVLSICRLVAGLPLALELASHWLRTLSPQDLAAELARNLDILSGRHRDVPARHHGVRATFEHSWRLLTRKEQDVLAKLAVFRGGFTRDAATLVADAPLAVLGALVDKSLLRVLPGGRYDRHPLVYQYSQEKLAEHPADEADAQAAHARYFLTLAEELEPQLRRIVKSEPLDRLEHEHDNLRAALGWSLKASRGGLALRLASALTPFWEIRGDLTEGCRWLRLALDTSSGANVEVRAKALMGLGRLTRLQGGALATEPILEEGLALWRAANNEAGIAGALNQLSSVALDKGEYARAQALREESLERYRKLGDEHGVATSLNNLGEIARCLHEFDRAVQLYEESLARHRNTGDKRCQAMVLGNLAVAYLRTGDRGRADACLKESLRLKHAFGDEIGLSYCLAGMAAVRTAQGELARAAQLLGATQALLERKGHQLDSADQIDFERTRAQVATQLAEPAFTLAWDEGKAMTLEQAVSCALGE